MQPSRRLNGRRQDRASGLVVRVGLHGPCVVLRLSGGLSADDSAVLRRHLDQAIAFRRPPWVIVDLAGLTSDAEAGLPVFVQAHDVISRSAGRLILTGLRGVPDQRLVVRQSLDEAIAELVDEGIRRLRR